MVLLRDVLNFMLAVLVLSWCCAQQAASSSCGISVVLHLLMVVLTPWCRDLLLALAGLCVQLGHSLLPPLS